MYLCPFTPCPCPVPVSFLPCPCLFFRARARARVFFSVPVPTSGTGTGGHAPCPPVPVGPSCPCPCRPIFFLPIEIEGLFPTGMILHHYLLLIIFLNIAKLKNILNINNDCKIILNSCTILPLDDHFFSFRAKLKFQSTLTTVERSLFFRPSKKD